MKRWVSLHDLILSNAGALSKIKGFFKYVKKGVDDGVTYAFSNVNEQDEYFENQMQNIQTFINGLKEVTQHADSMTRAQKALASVIIKLSCQYKSYSLVEYTPLYRIISSLANYYDGVRKIESRISSDEDLKLTDTLKFHLSNLEASKELLIRRIKCYVAQENSLKALNKAKSKNENIPIAEDHYQQCIKKCTDISSSAKAEIEKENRERVIDLKKNLISYAELQILHMKVDLPIIQGSYKRYNRYSRKNHNRRIYR
ncbi:Sorting nexin-5 [Thelohanellus kitauei]|uniref:Sorting nexin-5 n=1 Tax=Thelohanellus kitauei TaxID=669202 RepID=A0A0C2J039_THEKT|nr:Sorting nexin-5 [Thelohanellus kitauei]